MNGSKEVNIHLGSTTIFVALLVFSAIATEIFLGYLLVRGRSIIDVEAVLVGTVIWMFFSVVGEKFTKIQDSGRWILLISGVTSITYYRFFYVQKIISILVLGELFFYVIVAWMFGWVALWELWIWSVTYLRQRKMPRKSALIIVGTFSVASVLTCIVYSYQQTIMSFFDSHPWVVGLIGIVISIIVGVFVGRRTKD